MSSFEKSEHMELIECIEGLREIIKSRNNGHGYRHHPKRDVVRDTICRWRDATTGNVSEDYDEAINWLISGDLDDSLQVLERIEGEMEDFEKGATP